MNNALQAQSWTGNRSSIPSGEPEDASAAPQLHQAIGHLHGTVSDLQRITSALEKRLGRVLNPLPPTPVADSLNSSTRENSYVAEVHDLAQSIASVYGRLDSIIERLHV